MMSGSARTIPLTGDKGSLRRMMNRRSFLRCWGLS